MVQIVVTHIVNAPLDAVWSSWDDFANIDKFHPGVQTSFLLSDEHKTGLGALRQCDFADGKTYLKEKVIGYEPGKHITVEIYGTNAPIKDAQADFKFESLSDTETRVTMIMTFTPKFGIIGKMMAPVMKWQFKKGLTGVLAGNAEYVERRASLKVAA